MSHRNPLIVIAGPTAAGKTECAIWLAQKLNAEIVSADSMQVYKYMDIGTAKPGLAQQQTVKHHLIDLVPPDADFSVSDYKLSFAQTVPEISAAGKLPVVSGGTGLYIRASLRSFLEQNPVGPNWELRNHFQSQAAEKGALYLHQQLLQVDPAAAARIHPNDLRRVIRALEVFHTLGKPISGLQTQLESNGPYRVFYIVINRERSELYQRIDARVVQMVQQGLQQEVESLLERGYSSNLKSMQSLGYRQFTGYLQGRYSLETAIEQMKRETRKYAKRQLTWFRKEPVDFWVNISGNRRDFFGEILQYLEGSLHRMSNNIENKFSGGK
jgi:tRNA dimethylallyltransferase